jgi:hypothetical protein
MVRGLILAAAAVAWSLAGQMAAALTVNPARPITDRVNVNLIAVADDDGANSTAGTFGNGTQQAQVFSLVDAIYAQAGVDVEFAFRPGTYNSSFARTGTPGANNPRPQGDLNAIRNAAAAAGGVLASDPNTINVFLVTIVPGFSQLGLDNAAGLATINGNGVGYYGGSNLLGFAGGREVLASVLAHEIGHNLGLSHVATADNLMQSGGNGERLDDGQIAAILASRFSVPAPVAPSPDYNGDGRIDGGDVLVWQRGASPAPLSPADLARWKTAFAANGATPSLARAATPLPEPAGMALALASCCTLAARRRPRIAAPPLTPGSSNRGRIGRRNWPPVQKKTGNPEPPV